MASDLAPLGGGFRIRMSCSTLANLWESSGLEVWVLGAPWQHVCVMAACDLWAWVRQPEAA